MLEEFTQICKTVLYAELKRNSILCSNKEEAKLVYIVESGILYAVDELSMDSNSAFQIKKSYVQGDIIASEMITYSENIISGNNTNLLCLSFNEYLALKELGVKSEQEKLKQFLSGLSVFCKLYSNSRSCIRATAN